MNKAILLGRLGQDPELRYTPSGVEVCTFSMATGRKYKDKDGNERDSTQWHNIVAWRSIAKVAAEYLKKGSPVLIEGEITHRSYEDKDGIKRYVTEVQARNLELVGGNSGEKRQVAPSPADEDIPF